MACRRQRAGPGRPAAIVKVVLTPRQVRARFTQAEQNAITHTAMSDVVPFDWRIRAAEA